MLFHLWVGGGCVGLRERSKWGGGLRYMMGVRLRTMELEEHMQEVREDPGEEDSV